MRPLLWFGLMLALVGCNRSKSTGPNSSPSGSEAALFTDATPRLQPSQRFTFKGDISNFSTNLSMSNDGNIVAFAQKTGTKFSTQVWDVTAQPKLLATFPASKVVVSPSGKRVAVVMDGTKVLNLMTQEVVAELPQSHGTVYFRTDDQMVFCSRSFDGAGSIQSNIVLWDVANNAVTGTVPVPDGRYNQAFLTKQGKELWLFLSSNKYEIACYDLDTKALVRTIQPERYNTAAGYEYRNAGIYGSVSSDGSAFSSNHVRQYFFEAPSGKVLGELPKALTGLPHGFIGDKRYYLAFGTGEGGIGVSNYALYDWGNRQVVAILASQAPDVSRTAIVSANGKKLVEINTRGEGIVFDLSSVK